jgi:GNAT superfamily N-acetyltransferase
MSVLTGQWRLHAPLPTGEEPVSNPHQGRYLDGWMREGDAGVVAVDGDRPIGAAWYRRFSADEPGYGFLDEATPEISIAVDSSHRGRGIGMALLRALCERAGQDGLGALSLSVERDNPALRIYRRLGFVEVEGTADACTMRLDLSGVGGSR